MNEKLYYTFGPDVVTSSNKPAIPPATGIVNTHEDNAQVTILQLIAPALKFIRPTPT